MARKLGGKLLERYKALEAQFGERRARFYLRKKTIIIGDRIFRARAPKKKNQAGFGVSAAAQFAAALKSWPEIFDGRMETLLDEVEALSLANAKERTPVLSGEARDGWFVSRGPFKRFIANNQPHILRLEHGWSKQPNRWYMIRSTIKKIPHWVDGIARRLASADAAAKNAITQAFRRAA